MYRLKLGFQSVNSLLGHIHINHTVTNSSLCLV